MAAPVSGQPVSRQQALLDDGLRLIDANQGDEARHRLEEALALARDAHDLATQAEATRGLGIIRQAARDFAGARASFDEALGLARSSGNAHLIGHAHNSAGLLALALGQWTDVRASFTAAIDAYREAGAPALQASALRGLAFSRDQSDAQRIDLLRDAWRLVEPTGDKRRGGQVLQMWGDVLTMQGDYASALDKLEAANELIGSAGTATERAGVATSIGRAYRLHGLPDRAVVLYQQALKLSEGAADQRYIAQSLSALTVGYEALGRYDEALSMAKRGFDVALGSGNRPQMISSLGNLVGLHIDLGHYAEALALLQQHGGSLSDPLEEVHIRRQFSEAYAGLGRLDDARVAADLAVRLGEADARPEPLLMALAQRAAVFAVAGDWPAATADLERALDIVERQRTTLAPRDFLKRGFSDRHRDLFSLAIALRVGAGDAPGALHTSEQARGRAFQDLLAGRDGTGTSPARAAPATEAAIRSEQFVSAPTTAEIVALAARLDSSLISYWVASHETFIWVVSPRGPVNVTRVVVDLTQLESLVQTASSGPSGSSSARVTVTARRRALRRLYDLLVLPVSPWLESGGARRLTIVPHGPLFRLSFAALADPRGRYLIERHEIHYAPASGVFRFTAADRRRPTLPTALLVADPDLAPAAVKSGELSRLPGARQEVREAARLFGARAQTLVGAQATESRIRALIGDEDVLHFATHGVVSDQNPFASYLALSGRDGVPENDGRLTAEEIYALRITADLVVLSACRSAAGRVTGDGIVGLTRGFFYAGAPTVVATLWDVADEPARELMRRFYAVWLKGVPKAAALRTAQLGLLRALRAGSLSVTSPFGRTTLKEDPALWASFILIGEP